MLRHLGLGERQLSPVQHSFDAARPTVPASEIANCMAEHGRAWRSMAEQAWKNSQPSLARKPLHAFWDLRQSEDITEHFPLALLAVPGQMAYRMDYSLPDKKEALLPGLFS